MNVYRCHYEGNFGYCCRYRQGLWMFVPELGEPDKRVHRNIAFNEIRFCSEHDATFEGLRQEQYDNQGVLIGIKQIFWQPVRYQTIGGLLFSPS